MRLRFFAIGAALISASLSAHADQVFTFSNAGFSNNLPSQPTNQGTLTGTFTTNDALTTVLSFDITASPTSNGGFPGFEYTTADSTVTAESLPTQYFQLDSDIPGDELRIYFASGLSGSGGTIARVNSYEFESAAGYRLPTGTVVPSATPEPGSFVLLGTGLLGLAGVMRRRLA